MKASWNGRQFGACVARPDRRRVTIASRCRAARATASFMARKARRAYGSVRAARCRRRSRSRACRAATISRLRMSLAAARPDCADPRLLSQRSRPRIAAANGRARRRQRSAPAGGKIGERLHVEFDACDVLVRLDALDLGGGQEIGEGGADAPVVVGGPAGGGVAANGVFGDVAIMQIGERRVGVRRAEAGHVARADRARARSALRVWTWKAKVTSSKRRGVALRRLTTMTVRARKMRVLSRPVGRACRAAHGLRQPVRRPAAAGPPESGTIIGGAAPVLRHVNAKRRPARNALPLDVAIGGIELRLLIDKHGRPAAAEWSRSRPRSLSTSISLTDGVDQDRQAAGRRRADFRARTAHRRADRRRRARCPSRDRHLRPRRKSGSPSSSIPSALFVRLRPARERESR